MKAAWNKIKYMIDPASPILNTKMSAENMRMIINPITDFYILQNFDKCVEEFSGKTISVQPSLKGIIDSIANKYTLKR